jgi:hypothetical protein
VFILKIAVARVLLPVLIGFYDPSPLKSYRALVKGLWDDLGRKDGSYVERL